MGGKVCLPHWEGSLVRQENSLRRVAGILGLQQILLPSSDVLRMQVGHYSSDAAHLYGDTSHVQGYWNANLNTDLWTILLH